MKSLQLSKPHLLIVIGGPSSGKTTFATKFSEMFNAPFINASKLASYTENSQTATELVTEVMDEVQKTKQTIIYEPISGTKVERTNIAKAANKNGYTPLIVWVQTDPYMAETRATRKSRSNPQPIDTEEFNQRQKRFTAPSSRENYIVISGMHTYSTQAKAVLRKLSAHASRPASPTPERVSQPKPSRTVMIR